MNTNDILKKVDHTLLAQSATWEDIKVILDDGIKYGTASACIIDAGEGQELVDEIVEKVAELKN